MKDPGSTLKGARMALLDEDLQVLTNLSDSRATKAEDTSP